jgi:hypothetical protein
LTVSSTITFSNSTRNCDYPQFAYHESSFFLVRLLQTFSSVSFASDAQPPEGRPPASWKTDDKAGWKAHEKIRPRSHLTMFVFVRGFNLILLVVQKAHGWSKQGGLWVRMEEASAVEGV